jgi:shikimate kinase
MASIQKLKRNNGSVLENSSHICGDYMHQKIFIVGFMASGKTTYGKKLANELKIPFFDTDEMIEAKIGMTIPEFFNQWGEKYFRRMERDVLYGLLSKQESFVCSTGGGSVCQPDIMDWLNRAGETIWLDTPWEKIKTRMSLDESRPLALRLNEVELQSLFQQRSVYYQKAKMKKVLEEL